MKNSEWENLLADEFVHITEALSKDESDVQRSLESAVRNSLSRLNKAAGSDEGLSAERLERIRSRFRDVLTPDQFVIWEREVMSRLRGELALKSPSEESSD